MDWSSPGSSVHRILQARILEWVAMPSSRGSSNPGIKPRSPALQADSLPAEPQGKPKNTGVGSLSLLQRIFLPQESNWGLLHCRQILYQLNYQGSPRIYYLLSNRLTKMKKTLPLLLRRYMSCCLVAKSCLISLWPHGLHHARLLCPTISPGVCSNSCPLGRWCHPTISSPVVPFSSCPQSFSASGSFPMCRLFASGGQSIRGSASASVFPMKYSGLISFGVQIPWAGKIAWRIFQDSPGNLLNPGIKPESPALQADSLPDELPGKPTVAYY